MKFPIENTEKAVFPGVGKYDMPVIKPVTDIDIRSLEWIPFDYAMQSKDRGGKGIHFYRSDYLFERVWRNPDRYIPFLQQFGAVLSPDFSMYRDHPLSVQIWNMYRRHWLAAYWQMHDIKVIPTIEWVTPESYEWCFDGEPQNSIVSISSCGCMNERLAKQYFSQGCKEAVERLKPTQILWYGNPLPDIDCNTTIIEPRWKQIKEWRTNGWRR